jgi:hypothetical protein
LEEAPGDYRAGKGSWVDMTTRVENSQPEATAANKVPHWPGAADMQRTPHFEPSEIERRVHEWLVKRERPPHWERP